MLNLFSQSVYLLKTIFRVARQRVKLAVPVFFTNIAIFCKVLGIPQITQIT